MKKLKYILPIIFVVAAGLLTAFNYLRMTSCCDRRTMFRFSSDLEESIDKNIAIATFKHASKPNQPILYMERALRVEEAKYLFYEPSEYLEGYYMISMLPNRNILIIADSTIICSLVGFKGVYKIPDTLKIKDVYTKEIEYYVLDSVFQNNIDNIPDPIFLSQFNLIQGCND